MIAIYKIDNMLAIYLDTLPIEYMLAIYYTIITARENRTPPGAGKSGSQAVQAESAPTCRTIYAVSLTGGKSHEDDRQAPGTQEKGAQNESITVRAGDHHQLQRGGGAASVYTHNRALRHKLDKLVQERPQECVVARVSHEGRAADYTIPKGWVRIYPPRTAAPLTEEQKQRRREQLASIRKG